MSKGDIKWDSVIAMSAIHLAAAAALFFFSWQAFWTAVVLLFVTGCLGVTLGYHRLLTHRSFEVWKPLEYLFAFCGCLAWQNGPIKWVATHRIHHARSDEEGDPHSPVKSFWWGHIAWMYTYSEELDQYDRYKAFAPDMTRDPVYRFMNSYHGWFQVLLGVGLFLWGGVPMVLWGIFLRTVIMWHSTWFVNSAAHTWGYRTWASGDQSTNNWWVALLTYGEGWHNNHHAFPRSAAHGLRWWELDVTYLTIRTLSALGLAANIQLPTEQQRERLAPTASGQAEVAA